MKYTIALAGNPNSGKTTLFNALTGSNQYVGNWPGVTVERKEARFTIGEDEVLLVDLPGVYSLSPYSIEENITRHFIAQHSPDVVLSVVDATNIERNLYLTLQLMELECPVVVALNLMDELTRYGGAIDAEALGKYLGVPVVPISAKKRHGFDALFRALTEQAHRPSTPHVVARLGAPTQMAVNRIVSALGGVGSHSAFDEREHFAHRGADERDDDHGPRAKHAHIGGYVDEGDDDHAPPVNWVALKLLEGDDTIRRSAHLTHAQESAIDRAIDEYVAEGRAVHPGIDALTLVADSRYRAIECALERAGFRSAASQQADVSRKIDRVVLNRYLAFPIFFLTIALMFALTFGPVGSFLTDGMEFLIGDAVAGGAETLMTGLGAPDWALSLVLDGVIAGVGGVLTFLPQILIIFLFMSILEDSGYMARAAFITDKLLRRLGLSGRSFIPMLMGFGCTTTAIIAARGVENERDRRMTIMLTPFMSCGARLPVYGLFAAAFFERHQALVVLSLYLLGMLVMVVCGLILRKTTFREGDTPFVMELPPYRMPTAVGVMRRLGDRAKDFVLRAGTVIFAMSVVIWFMQRFSFGLEWVTDSSQSMFGVLGGYIAVLFQPLGFGQWEKGVALLSGLVAKEAVVGALQVLYSAGDLTQLAGLLTAHFTPLSAYAFLVFILLYTPCVAAIAALRREMHSAKYTLLAIAIELGAAYAVSLVIYQAGRLMGFA